MEEFEKGDGIGTARDGYAEALTGANEGGQNFVEAFFQVSGDGQEGQV